MEWPATATVSSEHGYCTTGPCAPARSQQSGCTERGCGSHTLPRAAGNPSGHAGESPAAAGNRVYEFDGRPALDLYKDYLGDYAHGLPATGMLFPLAIRADTESTDIVRTVLAVDDESSSMIRR